MLATSSFRQPSLNPAQSATTVQGDQAARVGSAGAAIQNVLSFLDGGLLNQLQYSGNGLAIDAAMSLLEREGIAQTLSSPSLTVLSGEIAQVQVGGEIPVPSAFAPAFGTTQTAGGAGQQTAGVTPGVFSSVDFVPFGVQLQIRPLVGDDDTITLDVQPMIVTPDSVLTDAIRQSTGTAVATTAFQTRALAHEFAARRRPSIGAWRLDGEQHVNEHGVHARPAEHAAPRAVVSELQPQRSGYGADRGGESCR